MKKKSNILAVDDSPASLALLVKILTPAGYNVLPADSGELALASAAANPPDLILLDVRMKGADGFEVCRRLKAREETRSIPIILISAFADVKDWVEGLQLGADDYITKPFQAEELLTRVKTHLSLRRSNLSLAQQSAVLHQTNEQLLSEIAKRKRVEDELRPNLERAERSRRALLSAMEDQKRLEEALRKSEIRFRSLYEDATIGLYRGTPDGTILLGNRALVSMLGYPSFAKLVERNIGQEGFESPNHRKVFLEQIEQHGEIDNLESTWIRYDGKPIHVRESARAIRDSLGNTLYYDGTVEDITERKRAESELRSTREDFKDLFDNAPVGYHEIDSEGRIVRVNNTEVKMLGYTLEEMLGKPVSDFVKDAESSRRTVFDKLSGTEQSIPPFERSLVRKDGTILYALIEDRILRSSDGVFTGIRSVVQDITHRKLADESLRQLSQAVEQSGSSIVITDLQGNIEYVNPKFQQITGYSFDEVRGKNSRILKSGFTRPDEYKELWNTITAGGEWRGEFRNKKKNGEYYWELATISVIRNSKGEITSYLADKEDITQRKQLEDELRQLAKLEGIGTLAGGIAHDFNNILGIILAYVTSVERYKNDAMRLRETVDTIVKAVRRGAALVQQILTFARKTDLEMSIVDVNTVVTEVMDMIVETFPKVITYSTNLGKNVPAIRADHSQVHQVMLNLCVNARDAMPEGGQLIVTTSEVAGSKVRGRFPDALASEYVSIEVADTGVGMSEETQKRIFEPFYTTKEIGKGTGLGLAVVFGVVKSHKGCIQVESELGKGTTFRIYLPVPSSTVPSGPELVSDDQGIPGGNETLLVVEDEEMLLEALRFALSEKGYKVITAVDGLQAVRLYIEHRKEISLVLTDLGLPKMGGKEAFKHIKQLNPNARVIVATGYLDADVKDVLLRGGAAWFVDKPYVLAEILRSIRKILDLPQIATT